MPEWRFNHEKHPESTDLGFVDLSEDDDFFVRPKHLYAKNKGEPPPTYWPSRYKLGAVNEDIVTGFIASDEFFNQATK